MPKQGNSFWQDNFNPKQPGWRDETTDPGWNCIIDDTGRIEIVNNEPQSWGHVYSPLLEIDIDQYPILTVGVSSVDPGANFSLEVQDFTGPVQTWVSQETGPGIYSIDLSQLMGWSGVHRFYCSIWVGGGAGRGINLRSVSVGEGAVTKKVQFVYDPFGRRIEKDVITNGIPEITSYIYDGPHIIQENNNKYIHGPRIDEPISLTRNGQTYYYHKNRLGTITTITDSSGNVVEEYHYDPFGRPLNESDIGNRLRFTGREWDSELGLYYCRARYYDPEMGRFISADPLTWAPNDPRPRGYIRQDPFYMLRRVNADSGIDNLVKDAVLSNMVRSAINNRGIFNPLRFHLYTYVHNNPVNLIDPWGLRPSDDDDDDDNKRPGGGPPYPPDTGDDPEGRGGGAIPIPGPGLPPGPITDPAPPIGPFGLLSSADSGSIFGPYDPIAPGGPTPGPIGPVDPDPALGPFDP